MIPDRDASPHYYGLLVTHVQDRSVAAESPKSSTEDTEDTEECPRLALSILRKVFLFLLPAACSNIVADHLSPARYRVSGEPGGCDPVASRLLNSRQP